ncbi:hypothetical protein [Jatrophihabitans fulvus]
MSQYPNDPRRDPAQQPTTQFGRDPYAQPVAQPGYRHENPFGTEGNERFGIAGMVCALLGAVLLIVCFTALDWFAVEVPGSFGGNITFGDISGSEGTTGFATAYFNWFAWTFMVIGTACAVGSSFPSPALRALRVVGVVTSFAAAGLSFLAVQVNDARSYTVWLGNARIGFYLAVAGFVLIGVGAAIGPRKV